MTAESIIVGFLIAYAPVFNQTIRTLDQNHLFSTVLAALLVYGLALTAFRSILLLYKSIGTGDSNNTNYLAGYELFLLVIAGSSLYILMNAYSVVHYGLEHNVVTFPDEPLSIIIASIAFGLWVFFVVFMPTELARRIQGTRNGVGNRLRRLRQSLN